MAFVDELCQEFRNGKRPNSASETICEHVIRSMIDSAKQVPNNQNHEGPECAERGSLQDGTVLEGSYQTRL